MRTKAIFAILVVIFLNSVCAQEKQTADLGTVTYYTYNDVWNNFDESDMSVKYEDGKIRIFFSSFLGTCLIVYDESQISSLEDILNKYLKWSKIATSNNEKLEKDISTIQSLEGYFYRGDEWYYAGENNSVKATFFSQSSSRHQIVFSHSELVSVSNEFISYRPKDLYLEQKDVEELLHTLSEKNIEVKLEEARKEKAKQDKYQ